MLQNAVEASTQPRFFIDITKVLKTWNNFEHVFPDGYMGRIQIGKREAFTLSLFATNHSLALLWDLRNNPSTLVFHHIYSWWQDHVHIGSAKGRQWKTHEKISITIAKSSRLKTEPWWTAAITSNLSPKPPFTLNLNNLLINSHLAHIPAKHILSYPFKSLFKVSKIGMDFLPNKMCLLHLMKGVYRFCIVAPSPKSKQNRLWIFYSMI